jgi:hypothetical protein
MPVTTCSAAARRSGAQVRVCGGVSERYDTSDRLSTEIMFRAELHAALVRIRQNTGILVSNSSSSSHPPLQRIHPDATYQGGTAKLALDHWRQQPTDAVIRSLAPGGRETLRVKPDGRIMNGNTRIKVLEERGFDVNGLPREIVN